MFPVVVEDLTLKYILALAAKCKVFVAKGHHISSGRLKISRFWSRCKIFCWLTMCLVPPRELVSLKPQYGLSFFPGTVVRP